MDIESHRSPIESRDRNVPGPQQRTMFLPPSYTVPSMLTYSLSISMLLAIFVIQLMNVTVMRSVIVSDTRYVVFED